MLYLVATPIGNLGDFSPRAREVLEKVDVVACEDTRTSHQLFSLLSLHVKKTIAYHDFNEEKAVPSLIEKLQSGLDMALVSDAGMPLISDPGYKLVHACRLAGIEVTSVPGANAVLTALQLSGLPSNAFYFGGFLSPKKSQREKILQGLSDLPATLIFYETANRLTDVLASLYQVLGDRPMAVVREITKKFEQTQTGTISKLLKFYEQNGTPKGEIVIVVQGSDEKKQKITNVSIADLRAFLSAKDTAQVLSLIQNISKKEAYAQVLENDKL